MKFQARQSTLRLPGASFLSVRGLLIRITSFPKAGLRSRPPGALSGPAPGPSP